MSACVSRNIYAYLHVNATGLVVRPATCHGSTMLALTCQCHQLSELGALGGNCCKGGDAGHVHCSDFCGDDRAPLTIGNENGRRQTRC